MPMYQFGKLLFPSAFLLVLGSALWPLLPSSFSLERIERGLGSIFFAESTTTEALQTSYDRGERIRVLVVPGHDNVAFGTSYKGVREADLNAELGEELAVVLSADPRFEPVLVRTKGGYVKEFADYFEKNDKNVRAFVAEKKEIMKDLLRSGMLEKEEGIIHNNAPSDVAYRLYSLNMWANENSVDIVIHIHFNDYPRKARNKPGRYSGYAIYVPDGQYSNARPSRELAVSIARRLSEQLTPSTHPQEGAVVPDQELIAVGSYNTLDPAVALIEYGYIYESRFQGDKRAELFRELARLTHEGLRDFFTD